MVLLVIIRDIVVTLLRIYADSREYNFITSYYAKWKTVLQMIFLYYLLLLYVGLNSVEVYSGNETIFAYLSNEQFIYFTMLVNNCNYCSFRYNLPDEEQTFNRKTYLMKQINLV